MSPAPPWPHPWGDAARTRCGPLPGPDRLELRHCFDLPAPPQALCCSERLIVVALADGELRGYDLEGNALWASREAVSSAERVDEHARAMVLTDSNLLALTSDTLVALEPTSGAMKWRAPLPPRDQRDISTPEPTLVHQQESWWLFWPGCGRAELWSINISTGQALPWYPGRVGFPPCCAPGCMLTGTISLGRPLLRLHSVPNGEVCVQAPGIGRCTRSEWLFSHESFVAITTFGGVAPGTLIGLDLQLKLRWTHAVADGDAILGCTSAGALLVRGAGRTLLRFDVRSGVLERSDPWEVRALACGNDGRCYLSTPNRLLLCDEQGDVIDERTFSQALRGLALGPGGTLLVMTDHSIVALGGMSGGEDLLETKFRVGPLR